MTWAHPSVLFGLWALLAFAGFLLWRNRAHERSLQTHFPHGFDLTILPRSIRLRRSFAQVAWIGALAAAVVALAEPRFGKRMVETEANGIDIILAVDLSRSMDARDIEPSRLERTKRKINDLVDRLDGDKVGLVMFAGGALPRLPLTLDYGAIRLITSELRTDVFQSQGSNLADAIHKSMQLLTLDDDAAGKAIVVLSDGEIHDAPEARKAAQEAADAGIVLYGWVVGDEPAPIPNLGGGWVLDPQTGDKAISTPDTAILESLARLSGGAVLRSVPGDDDVDALYRQELRRKLTAASGRSQARQAFDSAAGWPLWVAAGLAFLAAWLGDGRKASIPALLGLFVLGPAVLPTPAYAAKPDTYEADAAYRSGESARAVDLLNQLVLEHPTDFSLWNRLGAARYRAGDAIGAARAFDRARTLGAGPDAAYNAGNAWWRAGVLNEAAKRYQQALQERPDDAQAQQNLSLLQQQIQQQQQSQQDKSDSAQDQGEGKPQSASDPSEQSQDPSSEQGESNPQKEPSSDPSSQAKPQDASSEGQKQDDQDPQGSPSSSQDAPSSEPQDSASAANTDVGDKPESLDEALPDQGEAPPGAPGSDAAAAAGEGEGPSQSGEMSAESASRILDGIEEGHPRTFVPGNSGGKPW